MDPASQLLARNAEFAAGFSSGDRTAVPALSTVVVTCLDPRVDPAHTLGLDVGEAAVVRVLGGRVSDRVVRDVRIFASFLGQAGEGLSVIVVHHTDCGSARLADSDAARAVSQSSGVPIGELEEIACADPAESVRADVAKLRDAAPALPPGLVLAGYVYDVATGEVREVVPPGPA